jgi:hypothetical protein
VFVEDALASLSSPTIVIGPTWRQATPWTLGSSKPSTTILSLGPSHLNRALTEPVVPRSGRLKTHHPKITMTRRIPAPTKTPTLLMMIGPLKDECAPGRAVNCSRVPQRRIPKRRLQG